MSSFTTTCCIVGGGPAGIMAGVLLARSGVDVVVLERHTDFLHDFRGDTVHPSTLELIYELGLLDEFLKRPHRQLFRMKGLIDGAEFTVADFSHLPVHCPFVAFMPQWDFLDFLSGYGRTLPGFRLMMGAAVTDIALEDGRIVGVTCSSGSESFTVRATLTIGADGRSSVVRDRAGFEAVSLDVSFDVLWMKLPRRNGDEEAPLGRVAQGRVLVTIDRGDYWQCGFLIAKGSADSIRSQGIDAFRESIQAVAPEMADRVDSIASWDDVKLLTVKVDRLRSWFRPGLLMIGDAAHAMSPVGGVGINLAIQDAVAAANILAAPLRRGAVAVDDLRRVQQRREWPTRATQFLQTVIQNRVLARALHQKAPVVPPLALRLLNSSPLLQRIPARVIGMGFRPERLGPQTQGLG